MHRIFTLWTFNAGGVPSPRSPYLGQKSLELTAEFFAPGIISTLEMPETCAAFTEMEKNSPSMPQ